MSNNNNLWSQIEENIQKDLVKMDGYLMNLRENYQEYLKNAEEEQDFIEYFVESYYIDDLNELQILYNDVIDRLTMNINYNVEVFEHYKDEVQDIIKKYFKEEEYDYIKCYAGEESYKY